MSQKSTSDGYSYRDQYESGTLDAADEAVTLACEDRDAFSCQVGAGLTGTLVAELSVDGGTTWYATELASKTDGAVSSSLVNPSAGAYDILRTAGASHVRIRCSARSGGSTAVVLRGTETPAAGSGGATEATLLLVESAVDGLEGQLTTIDGRVDGIEALLTTIDGRVDTLETLLAPLVPGGNLVDTTGTAGTPEQINGGNSQACRLVIVSNWSSSPIAVGFSNAVDVALKTGVQIPSGQSHPFVCTNTNQIWVDVTTNGDAYGGVYYT